jgi:hypothetical protein
MMLHRARIARIIASILTIALATQIAQSQVVDCVVMSASQANEVHSGMTQHQQPSSAAVSVATRSGSDNQSSGTSGCNQASLCVNAAAIPATTMRAINIDIAELPISYRQGVLEARTLRPDPPPPRI